MATPESSTTSSSPKVIIAVDDSPQAYAAFEYYFKFIHRPENEVIVTHCIEFPYVPYQPIGGEAIEVIFRNARQGVSALEKKYKLLLEGKAVQTKVIFSMGGKPGEHLVHLAKEHKANLVVMGTRGMNKIRRTLIGSVSDYVVHHAHCPVIVYKEH